MLIIYIWLCEYSFKNSTTCKSYLSINLFILQGYLLNKINSNLNYRK